MFKNNYCTKMSTIVPTRPGTSQLTGFGLENYAESQ